jgi:hypothetical protein
MRLKAFIGQFCRAGVAQSSQLPRVSLGFVAREDGDARESVHQRGINGRVGD